MAFRVEGEVCRGKIVRGLVEQIGRDGPHVDQADRFPQDLL